MIEKKKGWAKMKILMVEDEVRLCTTTAKYLTKLGYAVDTCHDGLDALDYIEGTEYDVIILDIMLPGMDGISILRKIRAGGNHTHVLLLTAKSAVDDKVAGLDTGADDYLTKPFSLEELAARIRVLIRRQGAGRADNTLTAGPLTLDTGTKLAYRDGKEIKLTAREYAILEYLMHNRGMVLSRDKIEQHIFNYDYEGSSNVVDVYIRNLRMKIDADSDKKLIETVRGLGYVIR